MHCVFGECHRTLAHLENQNNRKKHLIYFVFGMDRYLKAHGRILGYCWFSPLHGIVKLLFRMSTLALVTPVALSFGWWQHFK